MSCSRIRLRYVLYFLLGLLVYGCVSASKNRDMDWEHLNYKKITCDEGGEENSLCKQNDNDISSLSRGKR
jgi:hypothetical protein